MSKQLVEVIKREEFDCPVTRTKRTRSAGYFLVPIDEAVKGIESGTYKAPKHPCGVVPSEWKKAAPKVVSKSKIEKIAGDKE